MRLWKLIGGLAVALAVLAVACDGDDGTPEEETPVGTPEETSAATPSIITPIDGTPIALSRTPVPCVAVEAEPSTSTIDLAQALPTGKIAFVSFRDEHKGVPNREIYLISSDGTGPINLTRNSCADDEPDWSPDGTRIAWFSDRDGNAEIYSMNADGSDVTQLTTEGGAVSPRWSPDGEHIAYARGGTIMVMNADGSDPVVVLPGRSQSAVETICEMGGFPGGWSPDGTRIVYYAASISTGIGHVCTVTMDGRVETVVGEPPVYNVEPVWSPDGERIAFRSIREGNHDVYVIELEDGTERRLTTQPKLDIEPDWSPDGEWIVFGSNPGDAVATDLYIMRSDGSDVRRLTEHPAKDSYPAWSP